VRGPLLDAFGEVGRSIHSQRHVLVVAVVDVAADVAVEEVGYVAVAVAVAVDAVAVDADVVAVVLAAGPCLGCSCYRFLFHGHHYPLGQNCFDGILRQT